jgi:hypothetical protein
MEQLDRGPAPVLDPRELVEVALVRLADGPMTISALEAAGIHVAAVDAYNFISEVRDRTRIMVPRAEFDAASELLAELGIV